MWRSTRDETKLSDVKKVAWEFILPYRHLPILDSDIASAESLAVFWGEPFLIVN